MQKTIVISAVNLRKGGTLAILRQYLADYSKRSAKENLRVIALVHDRKLCDYPGIEYIEMPWCIKSWALRLWAEYVTMHKISRKMAQEAGTPVDLWLSLHDTTPNVIAKRQEVYCHTSFPFLKIIPRDWVMNPKIPIFALMGRVYYRINVHRNAAITVQQQWFAEGLSKMLGVPLAKFKVIPPLGHPLEMAPVPAHSDKRDDLPTFLFVSTPDCHKNFETLCEAARLLEKEIGTGKFKVGITVSGDENRYARWLYRKWGKVRSIEWLGLLSREDLLQAYARADCFVFPSRVETWGLPISEYALCHRGGTMLLADLPYAHGTCSSVSDLCRAEFFPARDAEQLKCLMKRKMSL